jgi:asparagine synthase (glutamine-hydrolysing)
MPVVNESGDRILFFAGEEFPDPQTVASLKQRGHAINGRGPGYLVHLSEEEASFPKGLNGRFQGLLVNRATATSLLFNDRYGMQRVYFHESHDAFYFAAEAKAILSVLPELRQSDSRSLGEFVACNCVLEDRTLFKNIHVLPAASGWSFRGGILEKRTAEFRNLL